MNELFISPWLIYLWGIWPNLQYILLWLIVIPVMPMASGMLVALDNYNAGRFDESKKWRKYCICIAFIFAVCCIIRALMPDREYIVGMYVASQVTYEDIDNAKEYVLDFLEEIEQSLIDEDNE